MPQQVCRLNAGSAVLHIPRSQLSQHAFITKGLSRCASWIQASRMTYMARSPKPELFPLAVVDSRQRRCASRPARDCLSD